MFSSKQIMNDYLTPRDKGKRVEEPPKQDLVDIDDIETGRHWVPTIVYI